MRTLKIATLTAALVVAFGAQAQTIELSRSADDLIPSQLSAPKSASLGQAEPKPVHFAWALDAEAELKAAEPFRAESREFWTQLDANQMKSGWEFTPTAEGALVRISLQDASKSGTLQASDLQFRVDGVPADAQSLVKHQAGTEELKTTGAGFSEGTLVFQLADGLAGRQVEVALSTSKSGALVHVLEPQSALSLQLVADRLQVAAGGRVSIDASFLDAGRAMQAERVAGLITAPDGRSFELEFGIDKNGRASAHFELPADAAGGLEPWEIHAFGAARHGNTKVLRDARTAVMVSVPSARLEGTADLKKMDDTLRIVLPIEAAVAGRYEVRGTLFGTDAKGQLRPMAIAHAADRLSAGQGQLELHFPPEVMNPKLGAPYALRDLNLSDQSRLSLSEQRREALQIPQLP